MREKILLLFLFLSAAALVYFYFRNPRVFLLFFRTMRASRHAYYSVIFAAGYLLGVKISGAVFNTVVFTSGILLMNVLFASSLAINNVFDKKIDDLNDKDNILNSSGLGLRDYYILFFSLISVSLAISAAVSFMVLLLTVVIHITAGP
jgi:4-hydroxybenzoate polyprenyltransferase